jgi:hypothetical protein
MNKFDRWIREKTDLQKVSYQDEHWDSFASYMAQKNKPNLWKLTGLLLLLLFLLGIGVVILLGLYPSSGNATDSVAASSHENIAIEFTALDLPEYSAYAGPTAGENTFRENIPLSNNNAKQPKDLNGNLTQADLTSDFSYRGTVDDPAYRPQREVTPPEDTRRQFTEAKIEIDDNQNKESYKNYFGETSSLKGESLVEIYLLKSLLKPLANPMPNQDFSADNPFSFRNLSENNTTRYYSLLASGLFKPGSAGDGHFILGGSVGGEFTVEFNRNWSISSGLGLMWRRGTFGVQMDHPHLIYDFEKTTSGYQLLPQSTVYAQTHLHLGKIYGPWTVYGGATLNYLLGVRGELWSYEYDGETNPSTVVSEKQSEGWIGKEGIKTTAFSLDLGVSCRVATRWTIGLSSDFYPSGLIDENHASEYDFNSNTYSENKNDRWELVENKFHLSINLKYHLP